MQHAVKQERYRNRLRDEGLRPAQIWVPDSRRKGFAEECRRQSLNVRQSTGEREVLEWLEQAAAMTEGWK